MPIDINLYCKPCAKILAGGVAGNLSNEIIEYHGGSTCVHCARVQSQDKNNRETTRIQLSLQEKVLKAGIPTSDASLYRPKKDRSFADPVTKTNPKEKMKNEENGREIEKKFRVKHDTLTSLHKVIRYLYPHANYIREESTDVFWNTPSADFIRLRESTNELTVKRTDKGDITDRIEINLPIESFELGRKWAEEALGKSVGELKTTFFIYQLQSTTVSIYECKDRKGLFLEIEAKEDVKDIEPIEEDLKKFIFMEREYRSLFQIMFGEKGE